MNIIKIKDYAVKLFALSASLSVAANNIALGVITLIMLYSGYLKTIYQQHKNITRAFLIFWLCLLPSIFCSGNVLFGVKDALSMYVYRLWPFFAALSVCSLTQIETNNKLVLLSTAIAAVYAVYQGVFLHIWRVTSFSNHPIILAGLLGIGLIMSCLSYLHEDCTKKQRIVYFALFFLLMIALFFNATRGAWLAMAIVLPLIFLLTKNTRSKVVAMLALLALASCFIANSTYFSERMKSINSLKSNTERILIWTSAKNMFLDHPIAGVGMGNYTEQYQQNYISPLAKEPNLRHAHNMYLQFLAENGAVGFFGFCFLLGNILLLSIREYRKTRNTYALLALFLTIAFMIHGLTECIFSNPNVIKLYSFVLGECFWTYSMGNNKLNHCQEDNK